MRSEDTDEPVAERNYLRPGADNLLSKGESERTRIFYENRLITEVL